VLEQLGEHPAARELLRQHIIEASSADDIQLDSLALSPWLRMAADPLAQQSAARGYAHLMGTDDDEAGQHVRTRLLRTLRDSGVDRGLLVRLKLKVLRLHAATER
jgi:hypothetical protein